MFGFTKNTALIVVDMQNDFADPEGSLSVVGGEALVATVNREIIRAASAGSLVVYTQDWHPESTPHFAKDGGVWPVHCVADTWGAAFHPQLIVAGQTVRKGVDGEDGYSGFTVRDPLTDETLPTGLAQLLGQSEIDTVVVAGLALDYCVKATALDAQLGGFRTSAPAWLTAPVNLEPHHGAMALDELQAAGVQVD